MTREAGAQVALRVALAVALVALTLLALPFLPWLVLAAWLAAALRPSLAVLARKLGGRSRAAALLTLAFLLVLLGPIGLVVGTLSMEAIELGQRLGSSGSGRAALAQLVESDNEASARFDPTAILAMIEQNGAHALELAGTLAGIGAELALGLFVLFSAAYFLMVEGPAAWKWTLHHAPVDGEWLERMRSAFHETGRGLFVGIGLTGLVQAGIATITYVALDVPRALVLGLVTLFASVLPTIGTALVWVPVSIALAITGRTTAALILAVVGVLVVSSIDNVLRPLLTRWARLELHPFVVLIAMLGGLALLGPSGVFLGPLIARLAVEIVRMAREAGLAGQVAPSSIRAISRTSAVVLCISMATTVLPGTARADDAVDHAFTLRRPAGLALGNSVDALTMGSFDPGDPRIGLALIAAYAPTPLLLVEGLVGDDLYSRPFTIASLVMAALGTVASSFGFVDSVSRDGVRDIANFGNVAIGSIATAHALSWNLELMTNALTRLVFSEVPAQRRQRPTIIAFPVDGGAGITLRWID